LKLQRLVNLVPQICKIAAYSLNLTNINQFSYLTWPISISFIYF